MHLFININETSLHFTYICILKHMAQHDCFQYPCYILLKADLRLVDLWLNKKQVLIPNWSKIADLTSSGLVRSLRCMSLVLSQTSLHSLELLICSVEWNSCWNINPTYSHFSGQVAGNLIVSFIDWKTTQMCTSIENNLEWSLVVSASGLCPAIAESKPHQIHPFLFP